MRTGRIAKVNHGDCTFLYSYMIILPLTEAFKDSQFLFMGMYIVSVAKSAISGRTPFPSLPIIKADF